MYYCHKILHTIPRWSRHSANIDSCHRILPLAEFKCDLFFVVDLFLPSLSWHSSCFTPAFSPDLPCLLGDLSLRSIDLHGSIVLLNVFARNFLKQRFQTISNLLTNVSQKCIELFDLFLLDWRIYNESDLQTRSLARQFTKQISLHDSLLHITGMIYLFIKLDPIPSIKFLNFHYNYTVIQCWLYRKLFPILKFSSIIDTGLWKNCEVFAWNCFSWNVFDIIKIKRSLIKKQHFMRKNAGIELNTLSVFSLLLFQKLKYTAMHGSMTRLFVPLV